MIKKYIKLKNKNNIIIMKMNNIHIKQKIMYYKLLNIQHN